MIESPGGLPNGISLDNILDRQIPRNRRIAEILALCGLVERSGQGMNIFYETSVKEAKPLPDFTGTDDTFVSLTLNGLVIDKQMLSVINRIGNERLNTLTTADFLTINALYHDMLLDSHMQDRLKHLTEMGIVEHIGRSKYVLSRSLYSAVGKSGVHTRIVGLDRETNKELLKAHAGKGKGGSVFQGVPAGSTKPQQGSDHSVAAWTPQRESRLLRRKDKRIKMVCWFHVYSRY